MASPLTLYVQIKQDATSQTIAESMIKAFATNVATLLNSTDIVHYASLCLVPNPSTTPGAASSGYLGLLLLTDFDLAMTPYLQVFYGNAGINSFLSEVASIAYNPVPALDSFTAFENFIVGANLTPTPPSTSFETQFYQAYPWTVNQINEAMK